MALVNGTNYDHIDLKASSGGDVTRHMLQDTAGRAAIAPTEASATASAAHPAGSYFILSGTLYQATADIAQGGSIVTSGEGQNCEAVPKGLGGEISKQKIQMNSDEMALTVEPLKRSNNLYNWRDGFDNLALNSQYRVVAGNRFIGFVIQAASASRIVARLYGLKSILDGISNSACRGGVFTSYPAENATAAVQGGTITEDNDVIVAITPSAANQYILIGIALTGNVTAEKAIEIGEYAAKHLMIRYTASGYDISYEDYYQLDTINTLPFDEAPTNDSENLVKSGAVYDAISVVSSAVTALAGISVTSYTTNLVDTDIRDINDLAYNKIYALIGTATGFSHLPYTGFNGTFITLSYTGAEVGGATQIAIAASNRFFTRRKWFGDNPWGDWVEYATVAELNTAVSAVYESVNKLDGTIPYFPTTRTANLYNRLDGFKNWFVQDNGEVISTSKGLLFSVLVSAGRNVFRFDDCADVINAATASRLAFSTTAPQTGGSATVLNTMVVSGGVSYGVVNQESAGYAILAFYFNNSTAQQVTEYGDVLSRHLMIAPVASGYNLPYAPYDRPIVTIDNLDAGVEKKLNQNKWFGKKIWWCGTSIPEGRDTAIGSEGNGLTYPDMVGELLGATVYNKSLGSSMARANVRTGDYVDALSHNLIFALSQTTEEKQYLIDNWATIKSVIHDPTTYDSLSSVASAVLGASFESRLMPYLNGTYAMPDLFVFDHGHNDWKPYYAMPDGTTPDTELEPTTANISNSILAEDTYMTANSNAKLISFFGEIANIPSANRAAFIASVNRNCFIGAVNFLCTLILSKNPRARIVFIGNLDNWQKPQVQPAQESLAKSWEFPIIKMWEYSGFSGHYIPNTATFWSSDGTVDLTMKQIYCKDGVHPHSDTTGETIPMYAHIIANALMSMD